MKIVELVDVVDKGGAGESQEWKTAWSHIRKAIQAIDWPHGSGQFTIYPGKHANGVKLIKIPCVEKLRVFGWRTEQLPAELAGVKMGNLDALFETKIGSIGFEWETGNISSSHRALNKILLAMINKGLLGGVLVVPSDKLYPYLTDRIGNIRELRPYLPVWNALPIDDGILRIAVIEHDAESLNVKAIPKGTDGRALR